MVSFDNMKGVQAMLFEHEKKLEDYQKEHYHISQKYFDSMGYKERLKLYYEHTEEYRRLTGKNIEAPKHSSRVMVSSQVKD